jgi:hypothetical protein
MNTSKEIGKKEIESTVFGDIDTSQTNEIEVSEIDSRVEERKNKNKKKRKEMKNTKKHKKHHKEIYLSQDPKISSVIVREFVADKKETVQEDNDDL